MIDRTLVAVAVVSTFSTLVAVVSTFRWTCRARHFNPAVWHLSTLALASLIVLPARASAQAVAQSYGELARKVKIGATLYVTGIDGREIRGTLEELDPRKLTVRVDGVHRELPESTVREIKVRRADSLLNGALIGLAVGGLAGLIPAHYDDCEECHDSLYASMAVGTGVSLIADALVRRPHRIYLAPHQGTDIPILPTISGARRGVRLAFRF